MRSPLAPAIEEATKIPILVASTVSGFVKARSLMKSDR